MNRIVVTPRSMTAPPHPALEKLRTAGYEVIMPTPGEQPDESELKDVLSQAVGYLAGVEKIGRSTLNAAPQLKAISRNGVGVDNIDMDAAGEQGITVVRAAGANARSVAELTIAHMLSASRRLDVYGPALKNHSWKRRKGIELSGRTVGIVGFGRIGKMVAEFCLAIGMRVVAFDPYLDSENRPREDFRLVPLEELLGASDIISLHAPIPLDGAPIIDRAAFRHMKHGVIVVNTARFELLDPEAVRDALDNGTISVLTLDAFATEPPEDWSLIDHENVIATPHIGGFTTDSVDRVTEAAVDNLIEALSTGEKSEHL